MTTPRGRTTPWTRGAKSGGACRMTKGTAGTSGGRAVPQRPKARREAGVREPASRSGRRPPSRLVQRVRGLLLRPPLRRGGVRVGRRGDAQGPLGPVSVDALPLLPRPLEPRGPLTPRESAAPRPRPNRRPSLASSRPPPSEQRAASPVAPEMARLERPDDAPQGPSTQSGTNVPVTSV